MAEDQRKQRKKLFHCKKDYLRNSKQEIAKRKRSSSIKEHKVNALASGADEGRD